MKHTCAFHGETEFTEPDRDGESFCTRCVGGPAMITMASIRAVFDFQPTPECINALPEPIRKYIHDTETRCDPAGLVARVALLEDQNRLLSSHYNQLQASMDCHRRATEEKQDDLESAGVKIVAFDSINQLLWGGQLKGKPIPELKKGR